MWQLLVLNQGTWVDILPRSNNLTWNSEKDNLAVQINFDSIYKLEEGSMVSLMKDSKEIFRTILIKSTEKKFTFSYVCMDYMWYLNKSKLLMQFNNIAANKAIEQMCAKEDIKCNIASMSTNINKIYKQEISNIIEDILKQVEEETGNKYIKYMDINIFTIAKLEDLKIEPKFIIGNDLNINKSIEDMKNSVIVSSGDDKNINIAATAKDNSGIGKYGLLQEVLEVDEKNFSQAQNMANNTLKDLNKVTKEINVSIIAIEKGEEIKANRLIYMQVKEKSLDGWYKIKSASHTLNNDKHKISLTLEV